MIELITAPTNLGLRPPELGAAPGTAKAPEALREAGLYERLAAQGAVDAGAVLPARYVGTDPAPGHVRNEAAIIDFTRRLSHRIDSALRRGAAPLVIGGDCSILLAAGHALSTRGSHGLVHLDGHTDFRHPGNSDECASVAGEDLAAAVGLHWPAIGDIDGRAPYFSASATAHIGHRDNDLEAPEASSVLGLTLSAAAARGRGMNGSVLAAKSVSGPHGYWLQLDVDILDPRWMPAVDSPDDGGLNPDELAELLAILAPGAVGASVTVFDPDLDPTGEHAMLLTVILSETLTSLGSDHFG
ncbi:arginase family protein [Arenivirga flava]|uniref:Arginase n=1 Tax=Arenivirga flava TaxID=1930060 RepID=A0AA37XBN0_9MICO|nr:arginase family protein [Arenivirga flava]GMA28876.1 arginase [Arenivirga flava]